MQLDHRANSQEPRLRRANQRKESVTNSPSHAHRLRTRGKRGPGFGWINFFYELPSISLIRIHEEASFIEINFP